MIEKSFGTRASAVWTFGYGLAAVTGCAGNPSDAMTSADSLTAMPIERGELAQESTHASAQTIAVFRGGEGHRIEFLQHDDGAISTVEITSGAQPQLLVGSIAARATSLEIFRALMPERDVPLAILDAHVVEAAALERAPDEDVHVLAFGDLGRSTYSNCGSAFAASPAPYSHSWMWNNSWSLTYGDDVDVEESMVLIAEDITNWTYFYAGADPARRAFLGACVDELWDNSFNSASDEVDFEVQRKVGTSWSTIWSIRLNDEEMAVHRASAAQSYRYRGRVRAYDPAGAAYTDGIRDVGLAVAYDLPFGIASEH